LARAFTCFPARGFRRRVSCRNRDGIVPSALTLDVGGPLARTVEDVAIALGLTAGFDPNDPITEIN
jgi:Asp-tRNA(Asn)/Glu-tRNA(Gln) amidotransferase A subunit family amidase